MAGHAGYESPRGKKELKAWKEGATRRPGEERGESEGKRESIRMTRKLNALSRMGGQERGRDRGWGQDRALS